MVRIRTVGLLLILLVPFVAQAQVLDDLLEAIKEGNLQKVNLFLDRGKSPETADKLGQTALMYAANKGNLPIVKALLARKARVNLASERGETALILAARRGHTAVVEALLDYGADVNATPGAWGSALVQAATWGQLEVVELLLRRGADKNAKSYQGTALEIATQLQNRDPVFARIVQVLTAGVQAKQYRVTINTNPPDSIVRFLDSTTPYKNGMSLPEGKYQVQVSKNGYVTRTQWIHLDKDTHMDISLSKEGEVDTTPPEIIIAAQRGMIGVGQSTAQTRVVEGRAIDPSGVVEVTVHGKAARLDADGNFWAEILLKPGDNEIVVTALDTYRNEATKRLNFFRDGGEGPGALVTAGARYYGLIIGSNAYRHLPKLETAKADAIAVDKVLREGYGFETKLILDATRKDILEGLNDFRKKLTPTDSFLLYYAGHGEFDKASQRAYWLPIDARRDSDIEWIIADTITANIVRMEAKHILVVADSCYSGTLTRAIDANFLSAQRDRFIQKMLQKTSRTLMASGGNEPVSDSGGSGHSVFAGMLLRSLRQPEHKVFTAEELFGSIKASVVGRSNQTPEYQAIRNSGHDGGDFVFIRR